MTSAAVEAYDGANGAGEDGAIGVGAEGAAEVGATEGPGAGVGIGVAGCGDGAVTGAGVVTDAEAATGAVETAAGAVETVAAGGVDVTGIVTIAGGTDSVILGMSCSTPETGVPIIA